MKARLAKKLARTPIDRLAPRWVNNFFHSDRHDARFEKALAKWRKRKQRKRCFNENIEYESKISKETGPHSY